MARVTCLVLLTLIAVQYAEFASVSNRLGNGETIMSLQDRSIGDMIELFENLEKQVDKILFELDTHFPSVLEVFTNHINEILAEINITEYIAAFRQEIRHLIGENGENDPKNCGAAAEETVDLIAKNMEADINNCETAVQLVVNKLTDLLIFKIQKALKLKQDISMVSLKCMENHDNNDDILKCLEGEAEHAIKQVGELVDEIEKALPIIISTAFHGIEAFEKCMNETKDQASWHSVSMIGMLEECMHS